MSKKTSTATPDTDSTSKKGKNTFEKVFSIVKLCTTIVLMVVLIVAIVSTGRIVNLFQSAEKRNADAVASAEDDFIAKQNENEREFIESLLGPDTDVASVEEAMTQKQADMFAKHELRTRKFQLSAEIARLENEIIFAYSKQQPEVLEALQEKLEALKAELADVENQLAQ